MCGVAMAQRVQRRFFTDARRQQRILKYLFKAAFTVFAAVNTLEQETFRLVLFVIGNQNFP